MKTKKAISLILALFIVWAALPIQSAFASGTRWYVKEGSSGNGTSWADASSNLKGIMDGAGTNDEIWVAKGTYSPGNPANNTFLLKKGVKVYGGFAGVEASLSERDWATNKTILDGGNINHNVVKGGTDATKDDTLLDGFTIKGGDATWGFLYGGGMYNNSSSPTVANCTFSGNTAYSGGGMYNESSSPTVANCTFSGNTSEDLDGGGMYNKNSSPTVINCTFSGNTSEDWNGGGMYNLNSSPTVENCTFSGNTANQYGGGMFNESSSPTVANCTFSGNTSEDFDGGGMYNKNSSPTVTNCAFTANTTKRFGGGMYNESSSPTVTECTFSGNTSEDFDGGGMYNKNSSPTVTNCAFTANTTKRLGGGMYNYNNSSPKVVNCTLSGNTTNGTGGGMYNTTNSSPAVVNCTFSGNTANRYGGGMYNYNNSSPTVTNCTFSDNKATLSGGGINNIQNASPILANTILWGNTASNDRGPDIFQDSGTLNLKNCVVGEYKLVNADENISNLITGDPKLKALNNTGGNPDTAADVYIYKLQTGSSAIDAGLPVGDIGNGVTVPSKDQQGIKRPQGAGVDIGSYEAKYTITSVTVIPDTASVEKGKTQNFTANVTGTDDYNNTVTWSVEGNTSSGTTISDSGTLTVAADENATALTVKATSKGDSTKSGTATVTVKEAVGAVTEVTVDPETLTLTAGGAAGTLTATVKPNDAANKDVTWASNNEAVATVANGVVTPVAAGQAIITVKTVDGNKTATCTVTVQAAAVPVTGVKLNKTSTTLVVGGSETLYATVEPATATNKNVKWSSDKLSVATVDTIGNIKAVGVGTATITVTTEDGSKTATCSVTVQAAGINYTTVSGDGQTHTRSSGEDLLLTVKRNTEDNKAFGLFRGLRKDGAPVSKSYYTAQEGSLIIRLKSAWLDTLSAGLHTLSIIFEDGEAKASFTIKAKAGSFEDVTVPKDSFTFTKLWQGGHEKSIDWTLYDEMDQVAHKLFNKKVVSQTEWKYEAWFDKPVSRYVVEKPVSGYSTRYKNVGVYAGITDRCCNGGTIINHKIPQTGDEANPALWIGLLLLGITGIGIALMAERRRKTRK
ncbi:MAG: Ig-like domain-containing protein [Christensenellales bacterium]|jgi:parallel beta-helix repeat protein